MTESKEKYWNEQKELFSKIYDIGVGYYTHNLNNIEKAFELEDSYLRCIDEGTPGGVHLAGSGILFGEEETLKFVKDAKVRGIYSHAGCGAASIYAKNKKLDLEGSDSYGDSFAESIAEKSGIKYLGRIGFEELKRPHDFHIARVIYYDGTGTFDYFPVLGLPPGFIISRRFLPPSYAKVELETAFSIAFGDHGFKSFFTPQEPLIIVPVAEPSSPYSLAGLRTEILEVVGENKSIKIDGFEKS